MYDKFPAKIYYQLELKERSFQGWGEEGSWGTHHHLVEAGDTRQKYTNFCFDCSLFFINLFFKYNTNVQGILQKHSYFCHLSYYGNC